MIWKFFAVDPDIVKPTNCSTDQGSAFSPTRQCLTNLPEVAGSSSQLRNILALAFGVATMIAVITLVIAAFNFATAATDSDKIARSRRAIVLSLVGLVICLSAEAIVLTVLDKI